MSQLTQPAHFFPFAIHLLYGIVLASSFEIAANIFVPIETTASSFVHFANALAVGIVYFMLIAGWLSYSLAIIKNPHKPNEQGILRFAIDLVIMTFLFYLVNLTSIEKFETSFWHVFIWLLPALFFSYIAWDAIALKEYKDAGKKIKEMLWGQLIKSIFGFILIMFQALAFFLASLYHPDIILYVAFLSITAGIVFYYRVNSWKIARFKRGYLRERRA